MSLGKAYLEDVIFSFRKQKGMAGKAIDQLQDEEFFRQPGEQVNSIAVIVKHLAGNLKSCWTDFLTTDGDKSWRDRDGEFVIGPEDSRARLLAAWEDGWDTLFRTLNDLSEEDLVRKVTIRGEEHTVLQAIDRGLIHAAHHVGQILYVGRLVKTEGWQWLTIPPGQSQQYRAQGRKYLK